MTCSAVWAQGLFFGTRGECVRARASTHLGKPSCGLRDEDPVASPRGPQAVNMCPFTQLNPGAPRTHSICLSPLSARWDENLAHLSPLRLVLQRVPILSASPGLFCSRLEESTCHLQTPRTFWDALRLPASSLLPFLPILLRPRPRATAFSLQGGVLWCFFSQVSQ